MLRPEARYRILDFGCGVGAPLADLAGQGELFGIDNSRLGLIWCQRRGLQNVVLNNGRGLPFQKETFKMIFCLDVLEHLDSDQEVILHFYNILEKQGYLFITVPAFRVLWSSRDLSLGHRRRYTRQHVKKKLENAGFKILRCNYINKFYTPLFMLLLVTAKILKKDLLPKDLAKPPRNINKILTKVLDIEMKFPKLFDIPIGMSLFCLATK